MFVDYDKQKNILMSSTSSKSEKRIAFKELSDAAYIRNIPLAWRELAYYYLENEAPLGLSILGKNTSRIKKAMECFQAISSVPEFAFESNFAMLTIYSGLYGYGKNIEKADALAKFILNPKFDLDYEEQRSVFRIIIRYTVDYANGGHPTPPSMYEKDVEKIVAIWTNYQNSHRRSGMLPDDELQMMNLSYAYAQYTLLEEFIISKIQEGFIGAYWAYGLMWCSGFNRSFAPINTQSDSFEDFISLYQIGIQNNNIGALRAVIELSYAIDLVSPFSSEIVQMAISKLQTLFPDEYESMTEDFEDDGINFP